MNRVEIVQRSDVSNEQRSYRVISSHEDFASAKKALALLDAGEYSIISVMRPKVVISPPPQATRNRVDLGEGTVHRTSAKPKAPKKPAAAAKK